MLAGTSTMVAVTPTAEVRHVAVEDPTVAAIAVAVTTAGIAKQR
jgi:hypothetical protein